MSDQVETMAGIGLTVLEIGLVFGETDATIRKNFALQIATGFAKAKAKVAGNVFKIATNASNNVSHADQTRAAIFWLKCRANWSTTDVVEIKAKVQDLGDPNAPKLVDLKNLDNDELKQLEGLIDKLIEAPKTKEKTREIQAKVVENSS